MMAFRFSVLLQLSSCTYVYNYFSENARIKFIPIDADVSGVVMAYFCFIFQFPNLICYGPADWLIPYPMTAVVTVVFTSCPTRDGQQRNQFMKMGTQQQHNNQDRYVNELVPPKTWTTGFSLVFYLKHLDTNYSFLYLLSLIMCERVEKNNC